MQVGVIGGICLLACLLSVGLTEELGDSKQSEESDTSDQKEIERSIEDDVRRFSNDVKGSGSTEAPSDLKTDVNVTALRSLEPESKTSTELRNASQIVGDSSTSNENFTRSSSDSLALFKAPALPPPVAPQSSSFFMDSHFAIEPALPAAHSSQTMGNSNGLQANPYFSDFPINQLFVAGTSPSGSASSSALPAPPAPSAPSNTNPKNIGGSQDSGLRSQSLVPINSLELKSSQGFSTLKPSLDTITPTSIERSLAINTNKIFNKLPSFASNLAQPTTPHQGPRFSPLFSSEYAHRPASDFAEPVYQASHDMKGSPPIPQVYSYDSRASFDETRRDSKNDEIQVRNVDESQYSETMNSYPYTPLSSGSDTGSKESDERSGAPYEASYTPYQNLGSAYATAQVQTFDDLSAHNQGMNPYSFGYPPTSISIPENLVSASATAQVSSNAVSSAHGSVGIIDDAKSRLIWPHEYIFPHKMPGGENVIQCSRENELHHFWSQTFDCLVCICLNEYGLLEPVCASCSGCRNPAPPEPPPNMPEPIPPTLEPYVPIPIPDPYLPIPIPNVEPFAPSASAPSLILEPGIELELTTPLPIREAPMGCHPLPSGQLFKHPLNPCQLCMCKESINAFGKTDVRIECQNSSQCVLPPESTTLPPIPDIPVPVPLPLCEKFPHHVLFPHPKENCKKCKCSIKPSEVGVLEQQITCFHDTTDTNCVPKLETTTELATPPAPPIPIPVEPYPGPFPEPVVEPVPENFPPPPAPNAVTPIEPLPWPPISTTPSPPKPFLPRKGPLPGPSPHESCQPYPPNQPFQHPWDDCQICECSEIKAIGMINVEITCYTKLSCCIESPEHVISAIAGKSNSKASGGPNGEDGTALAFINEALTSTFKPPAFSPGVRQNQGYPEPNAIIQSSANKPVYQLPTPYQSNNAIGSNQNSAEASVEYKPQASFNPGINQNQGLAETNAVAQNILSNPTYLVPGSYPSVNAYSMVNGGSQSSAEANVEYNVAPAGNTNPSPSFSPFSPGISQNQVYAEASAIAQNSLNNPTYQIPGTYQTGAQAIGNVNTAGLSAEASEEYLPLAVTYKPTLLYPQYNPGITQGQSYGEANAQYNRPLTSTYKPPSLYGQYSPEVNPNQVYAEAMAQYNDLMTNTQKPPAFYGQYNPGSSQNQVLSQPNAQYSNFITSTFKPPALYNPYYNAEAFQNQAYAQANTQYNSLVTSTPKPGTLYGQYNLGVSQNQVYPSANAMYPGSLTGTEKPVPSFNPYSSGIAQNQAYAGANSQNSIINPSYYLSGPYQTAKATGSGNGADQTSAIAEAVVQSQDYSPYLQSGSQIGTNTASNPSSVYPYQSNYYTGLLSPQYSAYPVRTDKGLDSYKPNQIQYAGNYEFNGQADAISVLSPQNSYYPYGSGYSQGIPTTNMYSALYPKQASYEISPVYRPGQYGGSNAQSVAQAYATTKMQTKSGEGYPEDSEDSK